VTAASSKELLRAGIVTLSQIEQNWPITANAEAWDFNDLTCSSITEIRLIALNVTTPFERRYASVPQSLDDLGWCLSLESIHVGYEIACAFELTNPAYRIVS
jgi:hypothetical protein